MHQRRLAVRFLLPLAAALCVARAAWAGPNLKEFIQPNLEDISASVKVISKSDAELKKMGKSYVEANKLNEQEIHCKEPSRVRMQGKKGLFTIRYVTNGTRKLTEVPTLRIHKVDDIAAEPGKGDLIYEIGLITGSWVDRVEDTFVRTEDRDGKTVHVFEFRFKEDPNAKHTILVDPVTKTILEHTAHHRNQALPGYKKRVVFSEVRNISGVNVPTRATLVNSENRVAAVLRYDNIKVNSGLKDKLFTF
jgi:outer membrane lipoprotein-sorting protein